MLKYAPIAIFAYNRPLKVERLLNSLAKNTHIKETCVYFFVDGPRSEADQPLVSEVLAIISDFHVCARKVVLQRECNIGLANSVVSGIDLVFKQFDRVIVLEDDLETSPDFLVFMNTCLDRFEGTEVWHVGGFNYHVQQSDTSPLFSWSFMNCWGWGTWRNRWANRNIRGVSDLFHIKVRFRDLWRINLDGYYDIWCQVVDNYYGRRKSWAVFWYLSIYFNDGVCINPSKTLILNTGFDGSGETSKIDRDSFVPSSFWRMVESDRITIRELTAVPAHNSDILRELKNGYRRIGSGVLKNILKTIFYFVLFKFWKTCK